MNSLIIERNENGNFPGLLRVNTILAQSIGLAVALVVDIKNEKCNGFELRHALIDDDGVIRVGDRLE